MNTGEPNAPSAVTTAGPKTCPVCGTNFGCVAGQGTCWCAEVKLSSEATANLRARFADCLCPRCLSLAAGR